MLRDRRQEHAARNDTISLSLLHGMLGIFYLLLGCIPPLAAGPLAGLAFIEILRRGKGWYQVPFWVILFLVNLLVMFWIVRSTDAWLSIASFSACFTTPVAAITTVLVMRMAWRRLETSGKISAIHKGRFILGLVLIPALQIAAFVALLLFGPLLCTVGLVACPIS
jgi:hypothetical protein